MYEWNQFWLATVVVNKAEPCHLSRASKHQKNKEHPF